MKGLLIKLDNNNLNDHENLKNFEIEIEGYLHDGLMNKSILILKKAIKVYADQDVLYYLMAKSYYMIDEYSRAHQFIKQALYSDKSNDRYLALMGIGINIRYNWVLGKR